MARGKAKRGNSIDVGGNVSGTVIQGDANTVIRGNDNEVHHGSADRPATTPDAPDAPAEAAPPGGSGRSGSSGVSGRSTMAGVRDWFVANTRPLVELVTAIVRAVTRS